MRKILAIFVLLAVLIALAGGLGQVRATDQQATAAPIVESTPAVGSDPLGGATTFAKATKPTTVNLMLDWTPNTNHLGIYVAQAKGYYKEANLTVEIQQPGDVQLEQIVATGKAQFGISFQEQTSYARGDKLPIVSIAAIIQHNTSGFASIDKKKPLKSAADLAGLRYGAFGSAVEKPILNALLQCDGASADKIDFIDVGFADPIPLLEKERIDFAWLYYGVEGIQAKERGLDLDFVMLKDYQKCVPDYYTPLMITNEDMIKNQPDVVKAFVQATAHGYADAIKTPDEAADILMKAAPDLDPAFVHESAKWLAGQFQADAPRWGEQKAEIWQRFTDFLVANQALKAPIDSNAAFTNDFLPSGK
ncbi:MAG: ABC transporter substrate-binding protein [Chloroflexota bacterium]